MKVAFKLIAKPRPIKKQPLTYVSTVTYPGLLSLATKAYKKMDQQLSDLSNGKLSQKQVEALSAAIEQLPKVTPIDIVRIQVSKLGMIIALRDYYGGYPEIHQHIDLMVEDITEKLDQLPQTENKQENNETLWYIYQLIKIIGKSPEEFYKTLIDIIPLMTDMPIHQKVVFISDFLPLIPKCDHYPNAEEIQTIFNSLPKQSFEIEGQIAQLRHQFVLKQLRHPLFGHFPLAVESDFISQMKLITTELGTAERPDSVTTTFDLVSKSPFSLLRYVWHIYPSNKPEFLFCFPGCTDEQNKQFTYKIKSELKLQYGVETLDGYVACAGIIRMIQDQAAKLKLNLNYDQLQQLLPDLLKGIKTESDAITKKFEMLNGFNDTASLHLAYLALSYPTPYGLPQELRIQVQQVIKRCLKVHQKIAQIFLDTLKPPSKKKDECHQLAKTLASQFFKEKQPLMIKLGTPIPRKGRVEHG